AIEQIAGTSKHTSALLHDVVMTIEELKLAIVAGSQRIKSESGKTGRLIQKMIERDFPQVHRTFLIDLAEKPMPFWDETREDPKWKESGWEDVSAELQSAHGIVVIAPEWGGMVPA